MTTYQFFTCFPVGEFVDCYVDMIHLPSIKHLLPQVVYLGGEERRGEVGRGRGEEREGEEREGEGGERRGREREGRGEGGRGREREGRGEGGRGREEEGGKEEREEG